MSKPTRSAIRYLAELGKLGPYIAQSGEWCLAIVLQCLPCPAVSVGHHIASPGEAVMQTTLRSVNLCEKLFGGSEQT